MPVRKAQVPGDEQGRRPRTRASARAARQREPSPQTPSQQQQQQQSQAQSVFRHHLQQVQEMGFDSMNHLLRFQPLQKLMLIGICLVFLLFGLFGLRNVTSSTNTSTSASASPPTPIPASSHRSDRRTSVHCQAYAQLYASGPWHLATGTSDPPLTLFAVLDIDINAPPFSAFFFSSDSSSSYSSSSSSSFTTGSLPQPHTLDSEPWRIAVSSAFDAALKRLEERAGRGGRDESASWNETVRGKEAEDADEWERRWHAKHGLGLAYNAVHDVGPAVTYVREFLVWDKKTRRWEGVRRKKLEAACKGLKELRWGP